MDLVKWFDHAITHYPGATFGIAGVLAYGTAIYAIWRGL